MRNLFIKLGITTALSLTVANAMADNHSTAATTPFSSSNIYAGIEGGYDNTNGKLATPPSTGYLNTDGLRGFTYGGFVGYQSPEWNHVNLGVEFFYDADSANYQDSLSDPQVKLKKRNDYGFSVLPGYLVSDNSKVYARLGYVRGQFRYTSSTIVNKSAPGYQVGLGYLLGFAQNFGVRAEYDYSYYDSVNFTSALSTQFSSNEFKLGLEYLLAL